MKHEIVQFEQCTHYNSEFSYSQGYDRAVCTCGWKSAPARGENRIAMHTAHAQREIALENALPDMSDWSDSEILSYFRNRKK